MPLFCSKCGLRPDQHHHDFASPLIHYHRGDKIVKHSGGYRWRGVVSGHIITPAGEIRYIVAHHVPESAVEGGWLLCIYSDREIREDT